MPPENTNPVAKSEASEFEFDTPQAGNPRIRKRSLKGKPASGTTAPAPSPDSLASAPAPSPDQPRPAVYAHPATGATPASSEPRPTYVRPSTGAPTGPAPAQPSGVLYYSNGPHKEASMKTTPLSQAARPAPTSASQPIPQRTVAAAAATAAQAPINRQASVPQAMPGGHATSAPSHPTPASSAGRPVSGPSTSPHAAASSGTSRAVSTTVAGPASPSKPAGGFRLPRQHRASDARAEIGGRNSEPDRL